MATPSEQARLSALPESAIPIRVPSKHDALGIHHDLDVRQAVEQLAAGVGAIDSVYLFGSRRYASGSARSDVDLLVFGESFPQASVVAAVARGIDPYLDVFLARDQVAHSAINESIIQSTGDLVSDLNAVCLWTRGSGWEVGAAAFTAVRVLAGFAPSYTLAASAGAEPSVCRADVLFVTALHREYTAVVSKCDSAVATAPSSERFQFEVGSVASEGESRTVVAMVADRAGPLPAALLAFRGIEMFRPKLAVLVGITAGIEHEVDLGDLVIPDTVVEYEATKVYPDGEQSHGRNFPTDQAAIASVKGWRRWDEWLDAISQSRPVGGRSGWSTDAMASGNKVIASRERAEVIAAFQRKTVAIEMEALGLMEACQRASPAVPALVIKAVSDFADDAKSDAWHEYCSDAAGDLAITLVRERVI
jgi:nucleoside phosphorylase